MEKYLGSSVRWLQARKSYRSSARMEGFPILMQAEVRSSVVGRGGGSCSWSVRTNV